MKDYKCACGETDPTQFYGRRKGICKVCYRKKEQEKRDNKIESDTTEENTINERLEYLEKMAKSFFSLTVEEKKMWDEWREEMDRGVMGLLEENEPKMLELQRENASLKKEIKNLNKKLSELSDEVDEIIGYLNQK